VTFPRDSVQQKLLKSVHFSPIIQNIKRRRFLRHSVWADFVVQWPVYTTNWVYSQYLECHTFDISTGQPSSIVNLADSQMKARVLFFWGGGTVEFPTSHRRLPCLLVCWKASTQHLVYSPKHISKQIPLGWKQVAIKKKTFSLRYGSMIQWRIQKECGSMGVINF